jgi:hypothetical protein
MRQAPIRYYKEAIRMDDALPRRGTYLFAAWLIRGKRIAQEREG